MRLSLVAPVFGNCRLRQVRADGPGCNIPEVGFHFKMPEEMSEEVNQAQTPPDMLWIPGGSFLMGSADFYPEEGPVHEVTVDGFWMDRHVITNEQFARFVDATGYVTVAERPLNPADFPGAPLKIWGSRRVGFPEDPGTSGSDQLHQLVGLDAWSESWSHPFGPRSSMPIASNGTRWFTSPMKTPRPTRSGQVKSCRLRLMGAKASRGGLEGKKFTWGDEHFPDGKAMANSWQGEFPWQEPIS